MFTVKKKMYRVATLRWNLWFRSMAKCVFRAATDACFSKIEQVADWVSRHGNHLPSSCSKYCSELTLPSTAFSTEYCAMKSKTPSRLFYGIIRQIAWIRYKQPLKRPREFIANLDATATTPRTYTMSAAANPDSSLILENYIPVLSATSLAYWP